MVYVRNAEEADMPRIMEIELEAISPPWTHGSLLSEVEDERTCFSVACEDDIVLGFAVLRCTGDEGELLQIAVDKAHRRRGIASMLMDTVLSLSELRKLETVYLEVRESNEAAKSMYGKYGFNEIGRRVGYYIKPVEDSLTMAKKI